MKAVRAVTRECAVHLCGTLDKSTSPCVVINPYHIRDNTVLQDQPKNLIKFHFYKLQGFAWEVDKTNLRQIVVWC